MKVFGRYRLLERIAVGGMAEVFLARTSSIDGFDKDLIIKRIRPELSHDEAFVSLFIDEARVSIAMSHPNVAQVFDFGAVDTPDGRAYYLAMEFVNGVDLSTLLQLSDVQDGMPIDAALYIVGEAARGLDYAHNLRNRRGEHFGVIHRDISPGNIIVGYDGHVRVMDFGIAKAAGRITHTRPGMVSGKLVYMSPEHAMAQQIDARADIFSLGAVLWELLTGRRMYSSESNDELFRRIREGDVEPPSTYNRQVTAEVDALTLKALARRPDDRFASARAMGVAIARLGGKFLDYDMQAFLGDRRSVLPHIDFAKFEVAPTIVARVAEVAEEQVILLEKRAPDDEIPFLRNPEFARAVDAFRAQPNIWGLVAMGDLCRGHQQIELALLIYRIAALTFAQRGLLAQAMLCSRRALDTRPDPSTRGMLRLVRRAVNVKADTIRRALFAADGPLERLMKELLDLAPARFSASETNTKLLTDLTPDGFALLVEQAELRCIASGDFLVRQGDVGRELFLIANGRALVHATRSNGAKVYIASLTSGDFFGENGFFTGSPRTASVETLYETEVFVITPELYAKAASGNTQADATLLRFYKERVVDAVLATSEIFGVLSHEDRRTMLARFELRTFPSGATVIQEGETTGDIFLIKSGTAEVLSMRDGRLAVLSRLSTGALFGEVAALHGIARTASVVAATELATLVLSRETFLEVIAERTDVLKRVMDTILERARRH